VPHQRITGERWVRQVWELPRWPVLELGDAGRDLTGEPLHRLVLFNLQERCQSKQQVGGSVTAVTREPGRCGVTMVVQIGPVPLIHVLGEWSQSQHEGLSERDSE